MLRIAEDMSLVEFQFQMVRLKATFINNRNLFNNIFQFQMVRLKGLFRLVSFKVLLNFNSRWFD